MSQYFKLSCESVYYKHLFPLIIPSDLWVTSDIVWMYSIFRVWNCIVYHWQLYVWNFRVFFNMCESTKQKKITKNTKTELNEQRMKKNRHWIFWKFYDSFITSDRNSEKEKSIFIFTVLFVVVLWYSIRANEILFIYTFIFIIDKSNKFSHMEWHSKQPSLIIK